MRLAAFRLRQLAHHAPWGRIDALSQIFKPALTPPSSQGGGGDADAGERSIIESEHVCLNGRDAASPQGAAARRSFEESDP